MYFVERKSCPACNGKDLTDLYEAKFSSASISKYLEHFYKQQGGIDMQYLENASYVLIECENCKLVFQKYIGNDILMEQLYEHWIDPKRIFESEVLKADINYYISYAEEISNIIAYFNAEPNQLSFFDFGMGWGKWSLMVKAFGCQSFGTELSESRIDYATRNGINVISYDEIRNNKFDFINTEQVFEHIPSPLNTLIYLSSALKQNGIIKISVPNGRRIKSVLSRMDWEAEKWTKYSLNAVAPLEHINCFRQESIEKMATLAGLKKINIGRDLRFDLSYRKKRTFKSLLKDKLRPYFRNYLKLTNQSTYLFFQRP